MADNKDGSLKEELEEVAAGTSYPEIDDSRTRKSPHGMSCYVGRCGINYSFPACADGDITCDLYSTCRNPDKPW